MVITESTVCVCAKVYCRACCAFVVSHDRYMLDRICTHILACEGDSKWFFFPGNYNEYEANRKERLGEQSIKRITYAPLVNA